MSEPQQLEHKTNASFPRRGRDYVALPREKSKGRVKAHAVQTIQATPEEVFNVYQEPRLLHLWQEGVVSVTPTGSKTLHWLVQDPGTGKQQEFNSEIVESIKGKRHVSRITSGPLTSSTYTATFEEHPSGRGSIFTMVGDFDLPGGRVSNALASMASRGPEQILIEDVRHLKQMMESGEIPRVDGRVAGPRNTKSKLQRFMLGENMPVPPGTSDRPQPQDMPHPDESNFAGTAVLVAVPVIAAAAIWGLISRKQ